MDTQKILDMSYTDRCRDLLAACEGGYLMEAAARLVIDHGVWLHRPDFLAHVEYEDGGETGWLTVRWADVAHELEHGNIPCTGSERVMLEIALGLALGRRMVDLSDLVSLDLHNALVAAEAMVNAAGHRDQIRVHIDRHYPPNTNRAR